jgi:hypothetical protein
VYPKWDVAPNTKGEYARYRLRVSQSLLLIVSAMFLLKGKVRKRKRKNVGGSMDERKINPEGPEPEDRKPTNPLSEDKPTVGSSTFKIPHIGKKATRPLDLFGSGPFRGGSLGNKKK